MWSGDRLVMQTIEKHWNELKLILNTNLPLECDHICLFKLRTKTKMMSVQMNGKTIVIEWQTVANSKNFLFWDK